MKKYSKQDRNEFIDLFVQRNSKINLSAIREPKEIYTKHVLDALEVFNCTDSEFWKTIETACDIGTGGGFPLIPLAITTPDIKWTGLDARNKKILAIQDIIKQLGLDNCSTVHDRIEDHDTKYSLVTARAVAHAETLLPWIDHVLKIGGYVILYKKFTVKEDKIIKKYGRNIIKEHKYNTNTENPKIIYVLQKK